MPGSVGGEGSAGEGPLVVGALLTPLSVSRTDTIATDPPHTGHACQRVRRSGRSSALGSQRWPWEQTWVWGISDLPTEETPERRKKGPDVSASPRTGCPGHGGVRVVGYVTGFRPGSEGNLRRGRLGR